MRFSSVFQSTPTPRPEAAPEQPRPEAESAPATPAPDLPEDLDARVRLIGEWQLGEG